MVHASGFYGFDELNRITGIWEQTYDSTGYANYNTLNQTYSYDRYGNRAVSGTLNVASPSFKYVAATNRQKAPTDSDTDSVTDKMRYDAVGNLIKDIHTQGGTGDRTYNINNQMLTAVGPTGLLNSYVYDAAGHRIRRSINNGQSAWWQVYGIGGEVVAEYLAGASPTSPQKEYGYRQGELLVVGDVAAGCITRWLVTDQVGTPRILADTTGSLAGISRHDYLPFGEELTAGYGGRTNGQGYSGDCVRDKFVGYERDAETGLDYAEARYHGSVYGRFTSVDPAMGSARKSMPQSWNRYSYVMNQPLSLVDPSGEYWLYNHDTGEYKFGGRGAGPQRNSDKWLEVTENGYLEIIEDSTTVNIRRGTGSYSEYTNETVELGADGQPHIVRLHPADKMAGLMVGAYLGAPVAVGLMFVAPEVSAASSVGAASSVAKEIIIKTIIGAGAATAIQIGTHIPLPAPNNDDDDTQDVYVVRGGVAGPKQLQNGVAEHRDVPGLIGFSVQSAPGKTIEELAAAGQFRNGQISFTTIRELAGIGVVVVPSRGAGYHNTVVTSNPLSDLQAARISAVFKSIPNPAQVR